MGRLTTFVHRRTYVSNMVLAVQRQLEDKQYAMLWLAAYIFLLRVPSEVHLSAFADVPFQYVVMIVPP